MRVPQGNEVEILEQQRYGVHNSNLQTGKRRAWTDEKCGIAEALNVTQTSLWDDPGGGVKGEAGEKDARCGR